MKKPNDLPEPPPDWGRDTLTNFIDEARANTYATFHNLKAEYNRLSQIEAALRLATDNLSHTKDWFAAFFLMRAHACFLGAARLVLSGQATETYACLRAVLENALYGFYLSRNPASCETWLRRNESDAAKRAVRDEFTIRRLLEALKAADAQEGNVAEALYNETIDYGAHPNERALIQAFKMEKGEGRIEFQVGYLAGGDSPASLLALRRAAQVGVSVLSVFSLVYRERFDILGLNDTIRRLRQGL